MIAVIMQHGIRYREAIKGSLKNMISGGIISDLMIPHIHNTFIIIEINAYDMREKNMVYGIIIHDASEFLRLLNKSV